MPSLFKRVAEELPLIVLVLGVIVTVPVPIFSISITQPLKKLLETPACGKVTATDEELLKVTNLPQSEFNMV